MWQNKQTKKPYIICFHAFSAPSWCDSAACLIFCVFVAVVQNSPWCSAWLKRQAQLLAPPQPVACRAPEVTLQAPFPDGEGPSSACMTTACAGWSRGWRREAASWGKAAICQIQFSGISVMLIKGSWPTAAPLLRVSLGWIRGLSVRGPWFYSCPGQSLLMPTGQEVPAVLPVGHPCMLPGGLLFIQEVCKDTRQCWGQGCELRSPQLFTMQCHWTLCLRLLFREN